MPYSWDREYDLPDDEPTEAELEDEQFLAEMRARDVETAGIVFMTPPEEDDEDDDEFFDDDYSYDDDDDENSDDFDADPQDDEEDDGYGDEARLSKHHGRIYVMSVVFVPMNDQE